MSTDDDTEALVAALNLLVNSDAAKHLYASLTAALALRIEHTLWFADEAAALNPLLALGRRNPARLAALIGKVDAHRRAALKAVLVEPPDEGYDKTEYMREFMNQKRQRERRAAEIENLDRSEHDRLKGIPRLEFMRTTSNAWHKEMNRRLDTARAANGGKRLPLETDRLVRTQFWQWVDAQMDAAELAAKSKNLK